MKYGDVLQYPDDQDPDHEWLFMYLGASEVWVPCIEVIVIKSPAVIGEYDDDAFLPGYVTLAGLRELEAIPT